MTRAFTFTRALADWRTSAKRTTRALSRTRAVARAKPRTAAPPAGRFMTIDGVRLRYAVHGRGRALVLIHGNGTMIEDFEISGVVAMLAERFRVILFDRPGFGHSARPAGGDWSPAGQAALLVKASARLKADRPIVAGHSWGAMVACAWALGHPAKLSGLVLAAGFYFPSTRLDLELSANVIPGFGAALRASMAGGLGRFLGRALPPSCSLPPRRPLPGASISPPRSPSAARSSTPALPIPLR